jgi:hypothetical protein
VASDRGSLRNLRLPAAAFLRIYEPATGPGAAPARDSAATGPAADEAPSGAERAAAIRAACALPPRLITRRDHTGADVLLLAPAASDGVVRSCPVELPRRAARAAVRLAAALPDPVVAAALPPSLLDDARRLLAMHAEAMRPLHVRTSGWQVPVAWFALFSPSEGGDVGGGLRYLTPMAAARRGLARALAIARRSALPMLPVAALEELGRWLEEFHARSVVELDYRGLAGIGDDAESDPRIDWVERIGAALGELRAGDSADALATLTAAHEYWAKVRAFERAC